MRNTTIGDIPKHQYVYINTKYTHRKPIGFVKGVWFGLIAYPGRAWGLNVMLQSGAIYRNLPPHAIAFCKEPEPNWSIKDAQLWDCYGSEFAVHEYRYLHGLECKVRTNGKDHIGEYIVTVVPVGDAFSSNPDQAKEFMFIGLKNGRLTIQPTDRIIFHDNSFTDGRLEFPKDLKIQKEVYSCEEVDLFIRKK